MRESLLFAATRVKMRSIPLLGAVAVSALVVFGHAPARAQESGLHAEIVRIDDGSYPNARAVVNIEDTTGAPEQRLAGGNFDVTVNGSEANVVDASLASSQNIPLDVLFVMDTSGSMAGEPIAEAKAAAGAFVAELAPGDRVAVMSFDETVKLVQDYTNDRAAANAAIAGLIAHGNTALYQATAGAALTAGTSKANRRAVVLLSDGADFGVNSEVTRELALNAAASAGVQFFTVAEGSDIDADYLAAVAQGSKGRYLSAPTPKDLKALYDGIARLLQSQYVVTFDRSAVAGGADVSVSLKVTSGAHSGQATLSYRPAAAPAPVITISGVTAGEALSSPRDVIAEVTSPQPVSRVVFRVDGAVVAESTSAPYVFSYDPAHFGAGDHSLSVEADSAVAPATAEISFSSTPPGGGSGGGLPLIPIAAAAGAIVFVLVAGGVVVKRRRHVAPPAANELSWRAQAARSLEPVVEAEAEEEPPAAETIGEALGILISRAGPDLGSEYAVGGRPVSIGSGALCGVRIDDSELGAEEARIWVRNELLMLHRMTRLTSVAADGTVGGWTILDPGESFEIGAHRFEFRLLPVPQPAAEPPARPVAPADGEPPQPQWPAGQSAPASASVGPPRLAHLMPKDSQNPGADMEDEAGAQERAS